MGHDHPPSARRGVWVSAHTRLPPGLQPCCRTSRRCRCHGSTRLTIDHTQSGIHRCTGHCSSHRALDLAALRDRPDAEVIACLTACRGLGRWTAEWFLARTLGRPCVVAGDLGVRKAVGAAYCHGHLPSETAVRELTAHWGAATGVAQQLLLRAESGFLNSRTAHGNDWRLTHLQDTVTPLVYQQVTEPVRIVFLGALFQIVRTTALLSCQRCQGNSFCDQYQIVEFQAAHHGRWARSPRQAWAWSASVWIASRAVRNVAVRRTIRRCPTFAAARRCAPLYTGLVHREPAQRVARRREGAHGRVSSRSRVAVRRGKSLRRRHVHRPACRTHNTLERRCWRDDWRRDSPSDLTHGIETGERCSPQASVRTPPQKKWASGRTRNCAVR